VIPLYRYRECINRYFPVDRERGNGQHRRKKRSGKIDARERDLRIREAVCGRDLDRWSRHHGRYYQRTFGADRHRDAKPEPYDLQEYDLGRGGARFGRMPLGRGGREVTSWTYSRSMRFMRVSQLADFLFELRREQKTRHRFDLGIESGNHHTG